MNGGLEGFFRRTTADLGKARRGLEDDGRDIWIRSIRTGDNWATRAGRAAHEDFKRRVQIKDGWKWEDPLPSQEGRLMRPDINSRGGMFMELKPNTPTGRRAGLRQVKRYRQATDRPVRVIYYDPSDYL